MSADQKLIVEDVSLEEVKKGLADGSIALIDVREPHEWAEGHIAGATLNPLSTFDPEALPHDPGKRVVLQCRSGGRTLKALAIAQAAGRDDVRAHFSGSMNAWLAAGEDVVGE
jgi:rhodanese-related sulfurtransferase